VDAVGAGKGAAGTGVGLVGDGSVGIRDYAEADEAAWLACWGQVVVTSHAWGLAYQKKPRYERTAVDLVAVEGKLPNLIIGFIDIEIENDPAELGFLRDSRCGFVWELGLLPGFRGRGLGRALIEAAAERLRGHGLQRMEFWSMDEGAQRFYERLGMAEMNRHWRFWARPAAGSPPLAADVTAGLPPWTLGVNTAGIPSLRVELVHATASVADWPRVSRECPVIQTPPHEPHLCRGFDYRF